MKEILRRVLWLGLGLGAVWCLSAAVPYLWEVKPAQLIHDFQRQYQSVMPFGMSGQMMDMMRRERRFLPVAEYLSERMDGKALTADESLASFLDRAALEAPARAGMDDERAVADARFYPLEETELQRFLENEGKPALVAVPKEWFIDLWEVMRIEPHRAEGASAELRYPDRWLAPWLALAMVVVYVFIPWPRRRPEDINYRRSTSVWLPDWIGFVFAAAFFALPLWMHSSDGSMARILDFTDSGMGWLTLVFWLLAALFLSMCGIAAWYGSVNLELLPDRIRRSTLFSEQDYPFHQMLEVRPRVQRLPRWLRIIMALAALANPRMAGSLILGATSTNVGIEVPMSDGRKFKIWIGHLKGWERLRETLQDRGLAWPEDVDL